MRGSILRLGPPPFRPLRFNNNGERNSRFMALMVPEGMGAAPKGTGFDPRARGAPEGSEGSGWMGTATTIPLWINTNELISLY